MLVTPVTHRHTCERQNPQKGGDKGKEKEGEGRKPEKERGEATKKPAKDTAMVQEGGTRIEENTCRWKDRRGVKELEG